MSLLLLTLLSLQDTPDRVLAMLQRRCLSCHGPEKQKGGLRIDSREALLKGGESGPSLVPGAPAQSLLLQAVNQTHAELKMPPKDKLSAAEIADLDRWIRDGAPWRAPAATPAKRRLGDAWSDPENPVRKIFGGARLDLWSLKPVKHPAPPPSKDPWIRTDVDRFLLAELLRQGLSPSPDAPRRILLRRLSFDLTGLPPTPEEQAAFESDSRPDAYERQVDRLLASPDFGVRWARHWLDVVRYADSNGFERDEFRPLMYRYRDWVVRSLNTDKPFAQFVREQLAGDESVPASGPRDAADVDALVATGFLRLGTHDSTGEIFMEQGKNRNELMTDLANTTASAFLGLTVSCANCHDHKYDPVTQADHFRLRAFFAAVERKDAVLDLSPERDGMEDLDRDTDRALAELKKQSAPKEKIQALEKRRPSYTLASVVKDSGASAPSTKLFYQGDFTEPREEIAAGFLSVFDPNPAPVTSPPGLKSTGRRTALADWLVSPSNPLPARVFVNRVWHQLFGRGIVATPNDFGFSGVKPTHPELLDHLASGFQAQGGSLKTLIRTLVTSSAYRQKSTHDNARAAKDPDNRLLWRQNPRRLQAEALRDSMLAVSGALKPCAGGPPKWPPIPQELLDAQPGILETKSDEAARKRLQGWTVEPAESTDVRSLFLVHKRALAIPFLEPFDLPDPTVSCGRRDVTVVAPQALQQLNSAFSARLAAAFAARLLHEAGPDPAAQVRRSFELALSRPARPDEERLGLGFLERAPLAAWCRVLLNVNEFLFID